LHTTVIYASNLLPDFKLMCDLMPAAQPAEKIGKMKKLRRTLSESFSRIGECPSSIAFIVHELVISAGQSSESLFSL